MKRALEIGCFPLELILNRIGKKGCQQFHLTRMLSAANRVDEEIWAPTWQIATAVKTSHVGENQELISDMKIDFKIRKIP